MAKVGRYEITAMLGEGGMGTVFRATDADLMRDVAIKVIRREVVMDPSVRQRFDHEAKAAGMLNHPGIVTIHDRGEINDQPYIVMELVEGRTADALMQSGEMTQQLAVSMVKQVAGALDYAHSRQVIHRDIKPQNIMVQRDGTAKIMDFGIARAQPVGSGLTTAGLMAGSPHYVPPERYMTGDASGYTDQWALAITAYQALTGRTPFHADSWENLTYQICHQPAPDPRQFKQDLPPAVSAVLQKALSKKPDERYPNCSSLANALEAAFVQGQAPPPPSTSKLPLIAAGALAGLGLVGVAIWLATRPEGPAASTKSESVKTESKDSVAPPAALAAALQTPSGDMVLVGAGEARLGEGAARAVTIDAFYIDRTEVSVDAFRRFCQETGRGVPAELASMASGLPASSVTWDEARAFAAWAGKRLPTADEWEKAARGSNGQALPWGGEARADAANIPGDAAAAAKSQAAAVTAFEGSASPYGAIQMLGNVWEWTATAAPAPPAAQLDRYRRIFKELAPPLSEADPFYQARGGSFRFDMPAARWSALVWDFNPTPTRARRNDVGFRCAKDAR